MTWSACSPIGRSRSRWATWSPRRPSATPARRRTSSAPTKTDARRETAAGGTCPRFGQRGRSVSRVLCRRRRSATGDGHPSEVVGHPTTHAADPRAGQRASPPAGRPARVAPSYLALLQVEFARFTPPSGQKPDGGIVTVALVLVLRRTGITRHPALWSSDFPHGPAQVTPIGAARPSDRLADLSILLLTQRIGCRDLRFGGDRDLRQTDRCALAERALFDQADLRRVRLVLELTRLERREVLGHQDAAVDPAVVVGGRPELADARDVLGPAGIELLAVVVTDARVRQHHDA